MTCVNTTKEKSPHISQKSANQDMIRSGIIAELDAISLYQSQIENTTNPEDKEVLTHIMDEEKEHVAELTCILMKQDSAQEKEMREFLKSAKISELDCSKHKKNR